MFQIFNKLRNVTQLFRNAIKCINVKEGVSKIMRDREGNLKGLPPT